MPKQLGIECNGILFSHSHSFYSPVYSNHRPCGYRKHENVAITNRSKVIHEAAKYVRTPPLHNVWQHGSVLHSQPLGAATARVQNTMATPLLCPGEWGKKHRRGVFRLSLPNQQASEAWPRCFATRQVLPNLGLWLLGLVPSNQVCTDITWTSAVNGPHHFDPRNQNISDQFRKHVQTTILHGFAESFEVRKEVGKRRRSSGRHSRGSSVVCHRRAIAEFKNGKKSAYRLWVPAALFLPLRPPCRMRSLILPKT